MKIIDRAVVRSALAVLCLGAPMLGCDSGSATNETAATAADFASGPGKGGAGTVASRLGGRDGIFAFLETRVVPAELSDPEIAPFFAHLTESPGDIEACLANLLDHDLGGSSPHFGTVLADRHQCRSSMTHIHRGLNIPDRIVTKFIAIVGAEALDAGVQPADVQAVAKVLERYRGGVRNK